MTCERRTGSSIGCLASPLEVAAPSAVRGAALPVFNLCNTSDRDQDRALRPLVPSLCGTADRHGSTGVPGSHVILDHGGSRKQAARFQDILQPSSHACRTSRATTGRCTDPADREPPILSLGISLPRTVSNTHSGLIPEEPKMPALVAWMASRSTPWMPKCGSNGRGPR